MKMPDHNISTERLNIRAVRFDDLPALLAVNGDAKVTQYLPYPTWENMHDAHAWFERIQARTAQGTLWQYVVELKKPIPQVIGACLLFNFDEAAQRAETGYVLGAAHWGQGLMIEAMHGLVQFAFSAAGGNFRRLDATIDPRNTASSKLLLKLGFEAEGTRREHACIKGEIVDTTLYGMLKSEYKHPQ